MAIQLDLSNSQYGIPFTGAYFRIVTASVSRTRNAINRHNVMIDIAVYATAPQDEDTRDIEFRRYNCLLPEVEAMAGSTFLAKCYSWVMSQDDMTNSIGV